MFSSNTTLEVYFKSVLGNLCPEPNEPDNILKDDELAEFYIERIVSLIEDAWENRRLGAVSTAGDYAAVAFNRRPQFLVNGKRESKMYGTCSDSNFLGYEGSSDHSADMLYTWDLNGNLTGVAVCTLVLPKYTNCIILFQQTIGERQETVLEKSLEMFTFFRYAVQQATRILWI